MINSIKNKSEKGDYGFIRAVVIIVIALIVLAYFGFDIQDRLDRGMVMTVWESITEGVVWTWTHVIKNPAIWIWQKFVVGIVWQKILIGWEWGRNKF